MKDYISRDERMNFSDGNIIETCMWIVMTIAMFVFIIFELTREVTNV